MPGVPEKIQTWRMVRPYGKNKETGETVPGVLEKAEIPVPELGSDDVLVEIAGCGVCHTDLGYFYDGVPTVNSPPLTLGHEISGTVVAGDDAWIGRNVIIPAVMPCMKCELCKAGRGNRCLNQKMPGNSHGAYGGFSSHIPVPSRGLCVIEDLKGIPLSHYAVIADAGTTPYQAAMRAQLAQGDVVVVVGAGGVGMNMIQIAKALGAGLVIGFEVDQPKIERALKFGADFMIDAKGKDIKSLKDEFKALCKSQGLPSNYGLKIFECTGAKVGQEIGLALLTFVSKLILIGYGMHTIEFMFSRLMAFDAEIIGTWACLPEYYPRMLELVQSGKVQIEPFVETRPMSEISQVFEDQHAGRFTRRIVLEPDF